MSKIQPCGIHRDDQADTPEEAAIVEKMRDDGLLPFWSEVDGRLCGRVCGLTVKLTKGALPEVWIVDFPAMFGFQAVNEEAAARLAINLLADNLETIAGKLRGFAGITKRKDES